MLKILSFLWQILFKTWYFLIFGHSNKSLNENAEFLSYFETLKILNQKNKGLLIDWNTKRLSQNNSFEHLALIARTGGGKTSRFIIPNLLTLDNCSIVITDPSGELLEKTKDHLKSKWFKILVISPTDLNKSLRYNPLSRAKSDEEIKEISKILISSANPSSKGDEFWNAGAEKILNIILKCQKNTKDPNLINLHKTKELLNYFSTKKFDEFIAKYGDEETLSEYKWFLAWNEKTTQSFLSTAQISLDSLSNPNIANLLKEEISTNSTNSTNSLNFEDLRREKTALFLTVPEQKLPYYSFILNLFYTQLFNFLMESRDKNHLPIYFLLDEFWHLKIPNFSTIITTIRKYKVSISIILQSISQLESRYWRTEADTILNGWINSKIFFSGADLQTTQMLERILWKTKIEEWDRLKEENLLNSSSIRTLEDDEAIYLFANKKPIFLKNVKGYFERGKFRKLVK